MSVSDHHQERSRGGARRACRPSRAQTSVHAGVPARGTGTTRRLAFDRNRARGGTAPRRSFGHSRHSRADPRSARRRPQVNAVVDASVLVGALADYGREGAMVQAGPGAARNRDTRIGVGGSHQHSAPTRAVQIDLAPGSHGRPPRSATARRRALPVRCPSPDASGNSGPTSPPTMPGMWPWPRCSTGRCSPSDRRLSRTSGPLCDVIVPSGRPLITPIRPSPPAQLKTP